MAQPVNNEENNNEPVTGSHAHFIMLGASIMNKHECDADTTTFQYRWTSHFQVAPKVVFVVWSMLANENDYGIKPLHFMQALFFLKVYPFEALFSTICGTDEDTNRKWLWRTLEAIADLETEIVS